MKYLIFILLSVMVLSCTKIVDNPNIETDRYTIILDRIELTVLENWITEDIVAIAIDAQGDTLSAIEFIWKSSNEEIATVSNGSVMALSPGISNITAEYEGSISEPCVVTVPKQDNLYAVVENDSVTIFHDLSFRNCACTVNMDVQITNNLITITEIDTGGDVANCLCFFDFSVSINELAPDDYSAEVYYENSYTGNSVYYGSVNFTIEENLNQTSPEVSSQYQSDCYFLE
jgi:hypothetical protein